MKDYCTTMLYHDMNISRLMAYSQRIEEEKLEERFMGKKGLGNGNSSRKVLRIRTF